MLVGKYLAYLACTVLVVLPSVMVVYFLIVPLGGGDLAGTFPASLKDLGLLGAGPGGLRGGLRAWSARGSSARWSSAWCSPSAGSRPSWSCPGYLRQFTVAYYLQALVPHAMPQDSTLSILQSVFRDSPSFIVCLTWLLVFLVGFLFLAARAVERREYVLDQ